MDEKHAGEAFDALAARASRAQRPSTTWSAIELVDAAGLEPLQAEAIRYYVSEGTPVANLAETLMRSATAASVAATVAAEIADRAEALTEGTLCRLSGSHGQPLSGS